MESIVLKNIRRLLLLAGALFATTMMAPHSARAFTDHCDPIDPGGSDAQCVACDCGEEGWFWKCDDGSGGEVDCRH